MIKTVDSDPYVYAHPHDFLAKDKPQDTFIKNAPQTAKRILALT
jgi:hypothetical protein